MYGITCPQCSKTSNGAANRLVKDSCGHQKCRMCLLTDEENCQQCKNGTKSKQNLSVISRIENHTAVITCNGAAKKSNICPVIKNGNDIKKNEEKKEPVKQKTKGKTGKKNKRAYHNMTIPSHINVLKDPVRYKCNICNKEFLTKSHIKYHVYCTGQTKPFPCIMCPRSFITKTQLDIHVIKHTGNKPFTCNVCQKSFCERSKLNRHSLLHTSAKPYICSECAKTFRSKESLKLHTLIHRGEKPFSCRICDLRFNNTSNLNKHLISHSTEKAHMCDQCGKRFKLKWALTVHRRSHLGQKPFECTTCSRTFVNNKDLQRHQLIHLETKAYNCSICGMGFRRKDNLHRHVKNTHPGRKAEPVTATVKQLLVKPAKPVDNPNAINVITASPVCKAKSEVPVSKPINRTGTVINAPLKLAFKTSAFKNSYNIHRDCDDLIPNVSKPYDLAESVNICQKILSPDNPPTRNVIRKANETTPTSTEICQKILSPYPTKPLHYETSFEHKKHAIIKNIKFKLPPDYVNLTKTNVTPLNPVSNVNADVEVANESNKTYIELKPVHNATTSVIVNSSTSQDSNMHWRRRTSQNLCSKLLEN